MFPDERGERKGGNNWMVRRKVILNPAFKRPARGERHLPSAVETWTLSWLSRSCGRLLAGSSPTVLWGTARSGSVWTGAQETGSEGVWREGQHQLWARQWHWMGSKALWGLAGPHLGLDLNGEWGTPSWRTNIDFRPFCFLTEHLHYLIGFSRHLILIRTDMPQLCNIMFILMLSQECYFKKWLMQTFKFILSKIWGLRHKIKTTVKILSLFLQHRLWRIENNQEFITWLCKYEQCEQVQVGNKTTFNPKYIVGRYSSGFKIIL